jgi:hypothetical protein
MIFNPFVVLLFAPSLGLAARKRSLATGSKGSIAEEIICFVGHAA